LAKSHIIGQKRAWQATAEREQIPLLVQERLDPRVPLGSRLDLVCRIQNDGIDQAPLNSGAMKMEICDVVRW
ncbi:MAG: hypothetical protein ACK5UC_14315, partial [Planctomycetaceae bacterium]